jgi:hypothetical protein
MYRIYPDMRLVRIKDDFEDDMGKSKALLFPPKGRYHNDIVSGRSTMAWYYLDFFVMMFCFTSLKDLL